MRKLIFYFFFLCLLKLDAQTDTIAGSYSLSQRGPLLYLEGATLHIETDSIYLVNAPRYRFYREMHQSYLQNNQTRLSEVILKHYEENLERQDSFLLLLFTNNWETELRVSEMQRQWQDLQRDLEKTLKHSTALLQSSNQQLLKTNETLRKNKRRSHFEKLIISSAGIGLGALLGLLFL